MSIEEFVVNMQKSHKEEVNKLRELLRLIDKARDIQKEEKEVYEISVTINS